MGVKVREKVKGKGEWWLFINHKGRRTSRKIGRDKKLAIDAAKMIEAKLVLGEFNIEQPEEKTKTFKELADIWISLPHDWKESTRGGYLLNLQKHIYPVFGKMQINKISRKDIKGFFDKLYGKGLHLKTLRAIRAPLSGVFGHAVESELIDMNPIRDVSLKYKNKRFYVEPLDETEASKLLERSKVFQKGKYYPIILLALRTGLRIGEIQALKWNDIDFDKRCLEVRRSWRDGIFSTSKNHKRRRVDLSLHLTEVMKDHKTKQKLKALKTGVPMSEFIFTGDRDELLNRITFQNAINRCSEAAGFNHVRTHDLRHTYATIRLLKGHNIGDVSYQLGHSSIKITYDVYAHWIPGHFKSEVDELDEVRPNAPYPHPASQDQNIL